MQFMKLVASIVLATLGFASGVAVKQDDVQEICTYGPTVVVTVTALPSTEVQTVSQIVTVTMSSASVTDYGGTGETPTGYGGGYPVSSTVVASESETQTTGTVIDTTVTGYVSFTTGTKTSSITGMVTITPIAPGVTSSISSGSNTGTDTSTGTATGTGTTTGSVSSTITSVTGTSSVHSSKSGSETVLTVSQSHVSSETTSSTEASTTPTKTANAAVATGAVGLGALFGGAAMVAMIQHI